MNVRCFMSVWWLGMEFTDCSEPVLIHFKLKTLKNTFWDFSPSFVGYILTKVKQQWSATFQGQFGNNMIAVKIHNWMGSSQYQNKHCTMVNVLVYVPIISRASFYQYIIFIYDDLKTAFSAISGHINSLKTVVGHVLQ